MGNDFDWLDSPFLQAIAVVLLIAFPCFIIWELGERQPTLDLRLFMHRNFVIGLITLTLGFFLHPGTVVVADRAYSVDSGYSLKLAGLALLPLVLLGAPAIAVMHMLCKYIDARWLICLNSLGFAWTFYWLGLVRRSAFVRRAVLAMPWKACFSDRFYARDGAHPARPVRSPGHAGG